MPISALLFLKSVEKITLPLDIAFVRVYICTTKSTTACARKFVGLIQTFLTLIFNHNDRRI